VRRYEKRSRRKRIKNNELVAFTDVLIDLFLYKP
jgi:hypothetical protein